MADFAKIPEYDRVKEWWRVRLKERDRKSGSGGWQSRETSSKTNWLEGPHWIEGKSAPCVFDSMWAFQPVRFRARLSWMSAPTPTFPVSLFRWTVFIFWWFVCCFRALALIFKKKMDEKHKKQTPYPNLRRLGCSVHQKYKARLECARGSHFWRRFNLFNGPPQDRRVRRTIPVPPRMSHSLFVPARSSSHCRKQNVKHR